MGRSNNFLRDLAALPQRRIKLGFALVVAFDFYDGPEHGVALFQCGEAVRFSTLGDSRSRLFRAFLLVPLEGTWWEGVRSIPDVTLDGSKNFVLPNHESEPLTQLERRVSSAEATNFYVGVGDRYLRWCRLAELPGPQTRDALGEHEGSGTGFEAVHRFVKASSASISA